MRGGAKGFRAWKECCDFGTLLTGEFSDACGGENGGRERARLVVRRAR